MDSCAWVNNDRYSGFHRGIESNHHCGTRDRASSRSLSRNVKFYIDGAEDVLRSVAIMSGEGSVDSLRNYFGGLHDRFGQFDRLILLDKNENIIAVAPHGIKGVDFPIRFSGSDNSKRVLTSPIISPSSGKLVLYISIPVQGGES